MCVQQYNFHEYVIISSLIVSIYCVVNEMLLPVVRITDVIMEYQITVPVDRQGVIGIIE